MKLTTLNDVYLALKKERYKVELSEDMMEHSRRSLEEMLNYI